ncbi:hypothetical protein KQX54_020984 [Cotesia glomerata]|uniref:Uncharacterized protein n=1 Tax=Cotesia glomerata TaxID=32391 RepID=A0AAV7J8W5_COTGL|nr:hypothetical protein KQX54_020984 [Cotesia glomerata]
MDKQQLCEGEEDGKVKRDAGSEKESRDSAGEGGVSGGGIDDGGRGKEGKLRVIWQRVAIRGLGGCVC